MGEKSSSAHSSERYFLMHYLAPTLNNAISRREVILTSRHFEFDRFMDNKRKIFVLLMGLLLGGQSDYAKDIVVATCLV